MPRERSLRKDIVIRLIFASSIPLLIVGLLSYFYLGKEISTSIHTKNELLADAVVGEIRGILRQPYATLDEIVSLLMAHTHGHPEISDYLDLSVQRSGYFETIYLLDSKGIIVNVGLARPIAGKREDFTGMDFSGQDFYKTARRGVQPVWSDRFLSPITGHSSLTISIPFNKSILVGSFSIEHLNRLTKKFQSGDNIITSIVDRKGVLLFHPDRNSVEQRLNYSHLNPINRALKGETGTSLYTMEGTRFVGSTAIIPETGWVVLVSQNFENAYSSATKARNIFLIGLVIATIIVGLLALIMANNLIRPLFHLRNTARAIAGGRYDSVLPVQEHEEIEDLAAGFRNMATAIQYRERMLKESEEHIRLLLNSTAEAIYGLDAEGNCTFCNPSCIKMLGYEHEDEFIGKNMHNVIHHTRADGSAYPVEECRILNAVKQGKGIHESSDLFWRSDGSSLFVEYWAYPVLKEETVIGAVVTFIDITDRKQAEDAVQASEEKFSKAFRSSPTFIVITSLQEGRFIEVNDAFLEASGYSRDELIGVTSRDIRLWVNPPERTLMIKELEKHGAVHNVETRLRMKSGEVLSVLFSAEKIEMDGEACILAVILDITERKKLESQLLHAQKMESVGTLAGGVAHEFNNIITAVITFSELIKNRLQENDSYTKEKIDKILSLSSRAAEITQGLLAFSRKQHFELRPVNINDVIREIEKLLIKLIREDIEIRTKLSPEEPKVMADRTQIEQVIMNLATNARDAMPEGGTLMIETSIVEVDEHFIRTHGFGSPGAYVLLAISDTGSGIESGIQEKIFEPFFTTKEVGKGTGLGLSIIYGIIRSHGGYINLYSEPGKGSTFRIYLPQTESDIKEVEAYKEKHMTGKGETILVAEDESIVRESIRLTLEEFGYNVIEAKNGKETIDQFIRHRESIDLLILDIIMPGMNGHEAYKRIKEISPDIKVIFTSGYTADIIEDTVLPDKQLTVITKPFQHNEFLLKIRQLLEG